LPTNDAHYLTPEDARAHDVLLCIGSGKTVTDTNRLRYNQPKFLRYGRPRRCGGSLAANCQKALTRTVEIAERCDLKVAGKRQPPAQLSDSRGRGLVARRLFLRRSSARASSDAGSRFGKRQQTRGKLRHPLTDYQTRLASEIAMIKQMGFAGYFLIVWDFVRYAKETRFPLVPAAVRRPVPWSPTASK